MKIIVAVVVLVSVMYVWESLFGDGEGDVLNRQTADTATTATTRKAATSEAARPYETMPGDGYHNMGGVDGKDWGVWHSAGASTPCEWSIRATSPYSGATVLDSGQGAPDERIRVSIQPFGDVSTLTGEIDGQRVVFQTQGCGAWRIAS